MYWPTVKSGQEFESQIACALGLSDLRVGRHRIPIGENHSGGNIWIASIWVFVVKPSFHPPGFLAMVTAEGDKDVGTTGWQRAVLGNTEIQIVRDWDSDPVSMKMDSVRLISKKFHLAIVDGIGYSLTVVNSNINAEIGFSNPCDSTWRSLEKSAYKMSKKMVATTDEKSLIEFVKTWRSYLGWWV